jgi:predicted nucleotide-binding protein
LASRNTSKQYPEPPQVSPDRGIELLQAQIVKGQELLAKRPLDKDAYSSWELVARNYLEKAFGVHSPNVEAITAVGKSGSFPMNAEEPWWENHRAKCLQTQLTKIEGLVELLQVETQLVSGKPQQEEALVGGHQIFLVHGRDERVLHETARFLEKLRQDVIVLREQPNSGRTIIEKFIDYSDVGFAVVLLTPDDRGGLADEPYETQQPRARQNVLFELGYFIGKLGRNRVAALYVQETDVPSDYSGVLFVALDDRGGWKLELARELKAAGLNVDMNLAL